tara:strand:+ start:1148 stop:1387 length:240 start_codon:yes stop_codon:yes gene_type:complete
MLNDDWMSDEEIEQYYRDEEDRIKFPKLIKEYEYYIVQGINPECKENRLTFKHKKRLKQRVENMKLRLEEITGEKYKEV